MRLLNIGRGIEMMRTTNFRYSLTALMKAMDDFNKAILQAGRNGSISLDVSADYSSGVCILCNNPFNSLFIHWAVNGHEPLTLDNVKGLLLSNNKSEGSYYELFIEFSKDLLKSERADPILRALIENRRKDDTEAGVYLDRWKL